MKIFVQILIIFWVCTFFVQNSNAALIQPTVNRINQKYRWVEVKIRPGGYIELGEILTAQIPGGFICDLVIYKRKSQNLYFADTDACPYLEYLKVGQKLSRFQFIKKADYKAIISYRNERLKKAKVVVKKVVPVIKKVVKIVVLYGDNLNLYFFPKNRQKVFSAKGYLSKNSYTDIFNETGGIRKQEYKTSDLGLQFGFKRGRKGRFYWGYNIDYIVSQKIENPSDSLAGAAQAVKNEEKNKGLKYIEAEVGLRLFHNPKTDLYIDGIGTFKPNLWDAERSSNHFNSSSTWDGSGDGNAYLGRNEISGALKLTKVFPKNKQISIFTGAMLRGKTEEKHLLAGETSSGSRDDIGLKRGAKFDFFGQIDYQFRVHKKIIMLVTWGGELITQEKINYNTFSSSNTFTYREDVDGYLKSFLAGTLKININKKSHLEFSSFFKMTNAYKSKKTTTSNGSPTITTHEISDNYFYGGSIGYQLLF